MLMADREQALAGGRMTSGIVRRGGRLYRPVGPWSPTVHEYLRHLESVRFAGSPQVLGLDPDREILTYQMPEGAGHLLDEGLAGGGEHAGVRRTSRSEAEAQVTPP
jgi:hypothetical protein